MYLFKLTLLALAIETEPTFQSANRMMFLEDYRNMMEQDLQSSAEINPRGEYFLIELESKLVKEVDLMKRQLKEKETLINQLKYYLGEQSDEYYEDCSCSNYYDS